MNPSSDQNSEEVFTTPHALLVEKLRKSKEGAFLFRRRRQPDWTDNYTLYRDKVQLNRLTQRQSVNIPLIKSTIKTLLKDIDDPPILYFSNLDNDDQAEVFYNEYWKFSAQENQLVIKDIIDKRQVMLFGRSFKALNIENGMFSWEIVDPQDILIDRFVDPADIDSARFLIHEHIYAPLSSLKTCPEYDNAAVDRIQQYMSSAAGLIRAEENQLDWIEKQRRMAELGVIDTFNPILGETYVELNKFFIKEFNEETMEDELNYIVTCEGMDVLYQAKLEDHIGKTATNFWRNHYPYTTWGDEAERTDFWSDGIADSLRTLNKVMNAWFSQMVENRTLRNFGMNYFNSSLTEDGFTPQTFEPVPWGWYPIPAGDKALGDQIMRIDIPDLAQDGQLAEMNFIMTIAQQASAATTFQEGVQGEQQVTLGEVQLLLANAQSRVKSMAVYYTQSWEDFGLKFTKMMEAAHDMISPVVIHRKGRLTKKNYSKRITPKDYLTNQGYKGQVIMKQDQQTSEVNSLQRLQYSKQLMPTNLILDGIVKKKSLEFADLSSTEIAEVLKADEDQMKQQASAQQTMSQTANLNPGNTPGGQLTNTSSPAGTPPTGPAQQMPLPSMGGGVTPPVPMHP